MVHLPLSLSSPSSSLTIACVKRAFSVKIHRHVLLFSLLALFSVSTQAQTITNNSSVTVYIETYIYSGTSCGGSLVSSGCFPIESLENYYNPLIGQHLEKIKAGCSACSSASTTCPGGSLQVVCGGITVDVRHDGNTVMIEDAP